MGKNSRKKRTRRLPALIITAGCLLCLTAGMLYVDAQMRAELAAPTPVFSASADQGGLRLGAFGRELRLPLDGLHDGLEAVRALWAEMLETPASPLRAVYDALRALRIWIASE